MCMSTVLLNTSGEESLSLHAVKRVLVELLDKSLGMGTKNNLSFKKVKCQINTHMKTFSLA